MLPVTDHDVSTMGWSRPEKPARKHWNPDLTVLLQVPLTKKLARLDLVVFENLQILSIVRPARIPCEP